MEGINDNMLTTAESSSHFDLSNYNILSGIIGNIKITSYPNE